MKQILKNILDRLTTRLPALKYVDENWGQLDCFGSQHPVKYPCALTDIDNAQWSDIGNLCQTGIAQVRITIANLKLGNPSANPAKIRTNSSQFEIVDLMENIHRALHGWAPAEHAGRLTRTASRMVLREDGIKQYEILFSLQIADETAKPKYKTITVVP
ncbi:MAG: hypothetical protein LBD52_06970 [Prevotellaceae bacterium]|jgi:hypothetical protein|nr:hypothetical protein [Prevotellaceae bacterium]